jgi:hypothetical protein
MKAGSKTPAQEPMPSFNFRLEILLLVLLAAAVTVGVEAGMTLDNRFSAGFPFFQASAGE